MVAGSIPDGVIGIFHWHNPSGRTVALGSTQPLTGLTTLPPSYADCLEIWEAQPPGTLWAWNEIALPFALLYIPSVFGHLPSLVCLPIQLSPIVISFVVVVAVVMVCLQERLDRPNCSPSGKTQEFALLLGTPWGQRFHFVTTVEWWWRLWWWWCDGTERQLLVYRRI